MMTKDEKDLATPASSSTGTAHVRRAWIPPELEELERLTKLTLMSAIPGGGLIDNGGGSTVF